MPETLAPMLFLLIAGVVLTAVVWGVAFVAHRMR